MVTAAERADVDESVEKEVGICVEVLFWLHQRKIRQKSDCCFILSKNFAWDDTQKINYNSKRTY